MACPEKFAEELCPKCLFVLWTSKHELTLVPQTKELVSDEWTGFSHPDTPAFFWRIYRY